VWELSPLCFKRKIVIILPAETAAGVHRRAQDLASTLGAGKAHVDLHARILSDRQRNELPFFGPPLSMLLPLIFPNKKTYHDVNSKKVAREVVSNKQRAKGLNNTLSHLAMAKETGVAVVIFRDASIGGRVLYFCIPDSRC
jgi:hypothetical protein